MRRELQDPQADELRRRVMNIVPARYYGFDTLLELLDLVVTDQVPTAAVRCGAGPVLMINPDFVDRHCRSDEALFALIMHELHHVLMGHTRLFPRATPAHNLAFDAVINAYLCHLLPEPAHTLFTGLYAPDAAPEFLLRPPPGWPRRGDWKAAERGGVDPALCALHRRIYSDAGVTYQEIFDALASALAGMAGSGDGPQLLGDHDAADDADEWGTGYADPMLVSAIRTIVERWPPPAEPRRGRSLHDQLVTELVRPARPGGAVVAAVRRAFLDAATGRSGRLGRRSHRPRVAVLPLPDLRDRKAAVLQAMGGEPLLWESVLPGLRRRHDGGRVHLYVDVSGSMDPYIARLYGALRPFRRDLFPKVHLFSTRVRDVTPAALARGVRATDNGTDIACVIEHILEHRIRCALIATDGDVGDVSAPDRALLRQRGVRIITLLTPGGWRPDVEPVSARIHELPAQEHRS
jgi:hypothetical protein